VTGGGQETAGVPDPQGSGAATGSLDSPARHPVRLFTASRIISMAVPEGGREPEALVTVGDRIAATGTLEALRERSPTRSGSTSPTR
jgi:hypothetical protein